ncbi:MAG: efflux RND transporter permease subunit, partial [Janthinobacterium lividum]
IVEIENIVRHMRMGKTPWQASLDAADEIGLAVVATTMAIVAVFLPVALMPGISGQFFKQFGLTVVISVLISLLVARLVTPLAAAYFLRPHAIQEHASGKWMQRYLALLRWTMTNRWKTVGAGVAAFALTVVLFMSIPTAFQPPVDNGNSTVSIELTPGSTLEDTARVSAMAAAELRRRPEVEQIFETVGDNDDVRLATINLNLVPRDKRKLSTVEFERDMAPLLRKLPDARVNFQSQEGGVGGHDITLMLVGDDPDQLQAAGNKLVKGMLGIPSIQGPRIDGDLKRPEIIITPHFDIAANMGVSVSALSQTVRIATIGDIPQNLAKFSLSDRQIPIRVQMPEAMRTNLTTLENLPVPTQLGGSVPLKVLADIRFGDGPTKIRRFNQERRIAVIADLAPHAQTGEALKAIHDLPAYKSFPSGVHEIAFGSAEWQAELAVSFLLALVSGVLLVLAVLILLYRRALPPFVNLASLLLAPLGAMIALKLTGFALTMPVMIGLLMLFGIVAKNSILLVDFAIEEMRFGVDRMTAMLDAGHKRAQPIVMTSVAMIAGMLPIALALGGDGSWRQPMAVAVIGGIALSTVLTLVIVPAGFTLADDMEKWIGRRIGGAFNKADAVPLPTRPAQQPAE